MHEGDDAGIDGSEQQHDPMFESPDRIDHETDFGWRYSVARTAHTATCCEGHVYTTAEDSGDNDGDSTPGSSTPRPGILISSVKTGRGPGREEEEEVEEPQHAYRAGAGQPSGPANASGSAAPVRTAYRLGEEITLAAYLAAASQKPSSSPSSDSSDSASSVKTAYGPGEEVPESAYR
jgi:hypothetical protein